MSLKYGFNMARCLYNYHTRKLHLGNYPMIQDIEVTNACNLNCVFCKRDKINERGIGFITSTTFNRIVCEENRSMLRHTQLFMHGEPLLHPRIVEFVTKAKKYAKSVSFTTNAMLLNKNISHKLLEAGLDSICISFEGTTKETYEQLRRGATYEVVRQNLMDFVDAKKANRSKCVVSLAIIDMPETHKILPQFRREWQCLVDQIVVLPLHDWGMSGKRKNGCLWPFWGLAVYWDGSVSPCCINESPCDLGNVNDSPITELWNGIAYQKFRKKMLNGSACPTCGLTKFTFTESYLRTENPSKWAIPSAYFKLLKSYLFRTRNEYRID